MPQGGGGGGMKIGSQPEFYSAPTGPMQPGSFPPPGQPPSVGPSVLPPQPPLASTGQSIGSSFMQGQPGSFSAPQQNNYDDDIENEPPLLEELGINVEHILLRMQGVAFFKKLDEDLLRDADLSGPLAIVLALACCLLLTGKLAFGYVYGLAAVGCVGVCLLINVMSQRGGIDLYRTMSILGYGLIPIVVLAFIGVFVSLKTSFGTVASVACIGWATATSSRFFATAISMHQQRWLVAYPIGLVYTCFTLITVF
eukprot:TRINITY_DN45002_c0_g1_i1.p1 TRINITY_DN45002_c0_g1~~TRINITY_DN45002_c0_g1_i1.p1  ORF type:complete len:293 (+),score=42.58 TRINITY_DN45002_c0_g1_i1:119-880(+)